MVSRGKSDPRSDRELVRACNEGNARDAPRAFDALYERHRNYVVRVALRFVRDRDMALDVLQETFSYLLRRFPPSGDGLTLTARLSTLLYPVAKNSALTLQRKAGRFVAADVEPDELPGADVPAGDVAALLGGLSDDHREVILMRFVDEMSLTEIAAALGIPLGTVKSRLHLAIRRLRESPQVKELRDT